MELPRAERFLIQQRFSPHHDRNVNGRPPRNLLISESDDELTGEIVLQRLGEPVQRNQIQRRRGHRGRR